MRAVTGNKDYKFGDLTKKLFSDVDSNLEKLREDTFNELPSALWQQLFGSLDAKQRKELAIAVVQWAALVLVAFALVSAAAATESFAVDSAAAKTGTGKKKQQKAKKLREEKENLARFIALLPEAEQREARAAREPLTKLACDMLHFCQQR